MLKLVVLGVAIIFVVAPILGNCLEMKDLKFLKKLGNGVYGDVYAVRAHGHLYAFKVKDVNKGYKLNNKIFMGNYAQNLIDELNIWTSTLNKLDFAVHLHAAFLHGSCACYLMDYVSGGSLVDNLVRRGKIQRKANPTNRYDLGKFLDIKEVPEFLPPVVSLMKRLHENGVTHADMHAGNVLRAYDGSLLINDFDFLRRFSVRRNMCWKLQRKSIKLHETNIDYYKTAVDLSKITKTPISPDNIFGVMADTDKNTAEALRGNEYFNNVKWMELDKGDRPHLFEPTDFNPDDIQGETHFQMDESICKGKIGYKDKKILHGFHFDTDLNIAPRLL